MDLESVTITGFRAFKQTATFQLTQDAGLKLITGNNRANRRLGANGAGKSSLWEALVWCLYGTSSKGLRSSDLTSWGEKGISVECVWRIALGTTRTILRTSKPPRLYVDGVLAEQQAVDRELGLSRARFLHSVFFGQGARLFPDLSLPERATLFDDLMDMATWARASERSLAKYNEAKAIHDDATNEIARIEAKLEATGGSVLAGLEEAAEEWQAKVEQELEGAQRALKRAKARRDAAQRAVDELPRDEAQGKLLEKINRATAALNVRRDEVVRRRGRAKDRIRSAEKEIVFYTSKEVCSVCEQPISKQFADERAALADAICKQGDREVSRLGKELTEIDSELDIWRQDRDKVLGELASINERGRAAADTLRGYERDVKEADVILDELQQAAAGENPHRVRLGDLKRERKKLRHNREHFEEALGVASRAMTTLDYWRTGFKKVRLFILKRTLDMLEVDVGNALNSLGLTGWAINFETETDTKSGGTRTGIQIVVRSPSATAVWEAWSGGEGQRLRVAIAVGFANLIQRLAGTQFNFEVWDEPSSWLSSEGVEDLLSTLAHRAQQTGKSVWVLDHRALTFTAFSEIWEVKKTRTGSSIGRLQ